MTAYKKASAGMTVGVAGGTILPVDGFRLIEVDLDQPSTTIKLVRMVALAYVLERSRNLSPLVKQWSNGVNNLSTTKRRLFWSSRRRSLLF